MSVKNANRPRPFKNRTVVNRVVVAVAAAVLIPMTVLTLISAKSLRTRLGNEIGTQFETTAQGRLSHLADILFEQLTLLRSISLMNPVREGATAANQRYGAIGTAEIETQLVSLDAKWAAAGKGGELVRAVVDTAQNPLARQLSEFKSAFPDHVEIFITDKFGGLVASTGKTSDYFQADEGWWKEAFQDGKGGAYIGQPQFDESSDYTAVNMALPIYSEKGQEVIGVVRSTFRIDALIDAVAQFHFGKSGQAAVVDQEGRLVANSKLREIGRLMPKAWISDPAAPRGRGRFETVNTDGDPILAGYADLDTIRGKSKPWVSAVQKLGWRMIVHQEQKEAFASIADASIGSILWAVAFAVLIAILVFVATKKTLAPISELATLSHRMAEGDLDVRISLERGDEIGRLAEAFNIMADQISEMIRNLEERIKERTAELLRAKEAAEAATRAKSEFLAGMSHELRTPLNAVIGFSEILEDCAFGPLNDKQKKYVGNVLSGSRHLLQLINDILDISKVEAGKMVLEPEDARLETLFANTEMLFKEKVMKQRISLRFTVSQELKHENFRCDPRKFKQVLFNLVSNAVKFTPDGGEIRVKAERADMAPPSKDGTTRPPLIRKNDVGQWLKIDVIDTGIGIAPEDQERIFREFEQLSGKAGRQEAGTGLGLTLTQKLAALHGGHIFVESEGPGKGSTFTFIIPYEASAQPTPSVVPGPSPVSESPRSAEKPLVLIVEDNKEAGELVELYLTEAGYRTARAYDGKEALVVAEALKPNLITLDIALPSLDGWAVLSELKLRPSLRDIPVIVVSIIDKRPTGLHLGAVDYFVKPVAKKEFIEGIQRAVSTAGTNNPTILVVDDDAPTVELISSRIREEGFSVIEAYDGKQCMDIVYEKLPDVIILDLLMPNMNGFEVVQKLRGDERTAEIPILIYTAKELTEDDGMILSTNMIEIATKNALNKADFISTVKRLVKTDRAETKREAQPSYRP